MSFAKEYIAIFSQNRGYCEFYNLNNERCNKPTVAIYVSDDSYKEARFVCKECAEEAELNGDGPVFWPRETGPAEHATHQDQE